MSFDTLQPELWVQILTQLRRPVPVPNSEPPRNETRQHELAVMMRVSPALNNLAAPILYHHMIIDDPALLGDFADFRATRTPAQPCVRSQLELLRLCRHLSLEYADPDQTTVYMDIMRTDDQILWYLIDHSEEEMVTNRLAAMAFAWRSFFMRYLGEFGDYDNDEGFFRHLKSLTFGRIFGSLDDDWQETLDNYRDGYEFIDLADRGVFSYSPLHHLAYKFLRATSPRHFCVSSGIGPLNIPDIHFVVPPDHPQHVTCHFNTESTPSILIGQPVTWKYNGSGMQRYVTHDEIASNIPAWIEGILGARKAVENCSNPHCGGKELCHPTALNSSPLLLDVQTICGKKFQRKRLVNYHLRDAKRKVKAIEVELQQMLSAQDSPNPKDRLTCSVLTESTPKCKACGE